MLTGTLVQAVFAECLLGVVGIVDHRWEQVPADLLLIAIFALRARRLYRSTTDRLADRSRLRRRSSF